MKEQTSRTFEITSRVSLCKAPADKQLVCGGRTFQSGHFRAYCKFQLAHVFPVTTIWNTGFYPQVIANSFESLNETVFDLAHLVRSYKPSEIPRDVTLGTILAVEFPEAPADGWKVQPYRDKAPGITAVAVMHRQLERVEDVLETWENGQIDWTVSMEQSFTVENEIPVTSGFAVHAPSGGAVGVEDFEKTTPEDLLALNYIYVPVTKAPASMVACFDSTEARIRDDWRGQELVMLFGGLTGQVYFKGAGLCPLGAEPEARVAQMLASGQSVADVEQHFKKLFEPDVALPFRNMLKVIGK